VKARGIGKHGGSWLLLALTLALTSWASAPRRASAQDQFVLVDMTFTATAQNTMLSQYALKPLAGAPANWRSPVDYASGSIYVRFEVMEKPSARSTLCNVCFENSGTLTCMPYAPPYTATGVTTSAPKIPKFWQYDVYDWTKPVELVQVVLKDEDTKLVQGDPQFYPTKMRVTVTVVPPGKTYVEDSTTGGGGEIKPDAGAPSTAGGRGGSGNVAGGSGGSRAAAAAGTGAVKAGTGAVSGVAGKAAAAGAAGRAGSSAGASPVAGALTTGVSQAAGAGGPEAADAGAMRPGVHDYLDPGSKCSVHGGYVHGDRSLSTGVWIATLLGVLRVRRRRRSTRDAGTR